MEPFAGPSWFCGGALLLATLPGCGNNPPQTTMSATSSTGETEGTTGETEGTTDGPPSEPLHPVDPCRLVQLGEFPGVGLGFPRSGERVRSLGTVRAAVLFADFPDVSATMTPEQVMDILSPTAPEFVADVSYGRMQLVLEPHLEWLRMSQPSATYAEAIKSFGAHRDWLQEAVDLADPSVDFSTIDLVLVLAAPNASEIAYGPTWTGYTGAGGALEADGAQIKNGITSGADLLDWGGSWLNHELGHSLSLVDSYSYTESIGFTRPFSLMDWIASEAPEYLAYERWLLGWLDDTRVACLPGSETVVLSPIESPEGLAAIMIPLSPTRALVVESRRALGWDTALTDEGAVVYTVDTSIASGSGPIRVLNGQSALGSGESLSAEGITIEVTAADANTDTVSVSF